MAFDKKQYAKEYYLKHKEKLLNKQNEYYKTNKNIYEAYYENNKKKIIEHQKEYNKEYNKTPMGRASMLLRAYNNADKKRGRGKGDLTAQWIVENIFTKPCAHCGISGWEVIGCNRLDNDKPHTKYNVETCCFKCNTSLNKMERDNLGRYKKRDTN